MAGFISKHNRYGRKKRDTRYALSDSFSAFYLKWMANVTTQELMENSNYWQFISSSQSWINWSGNRFEAVCHKHILQIKKALGISRVLLTYILKHTIGKVEAMRAKKVHRLICL